MHRETVRFVDTNVLQATRFGRADPLSHEQAVLLVESFLRFPVAALTTPIVRAAFETRERFGISYWDAAILEAARAPRV